LLSWFVSLYFSDARKEDMREETSNIRQTTSKILEMTVTGYESSFEQRPQSRDASD
jgi:hypothetical protein